MPTKKYADKGKWQLVSTIARVKVSDVVAFHANQHGGVAPVEVDFSADGVPESKMSSISFTVISIRFAYGCRVYPILIGYAGRESRKLDEETLCHQVLLDIKKAGLTVRDGLGDAPMRSKFRNAIAHNGNYVSCLNLFTCIYTMCFNSDSTMFYNGDKTLR